MGSNQAAHSAGRPGTPNARAAQGALWPRPGVVYASATNRIYFATGNGRYAPSGLAWGDTVLALDPDGTSSGGDPLDSYTPLSVLAAILIVVAWNMGEWRAIPQLWKLTKSDHNVGLVTLALTVFVALTVAVEV